jgi:hypothetical protein
MNISKILELLNQMPSPGDMSLDSQIEQARIMYEVLGTPLNLAIYNSLKELKSMKQKQVEKWKTQNSK